MPTSRRDPAGCAGCSWADARRRRTDAGPLPDHKRWSTFRLDDGPDGGAAATGVVPPERPEPSVEAHGVYARHPEVLEPWDVALRLGRGVQPDMRRGWAWKTPLGDGRLELGPRPFPPSC